MQKAMLETGIRPFNDGCIDFFDVIEEGMTIEAAKAAVSKEFKDDTFHNGLCRGRAEKFLDCILRA